MRWLGLLLLLVVALALELQYYGQRSSRSPTRPAGAVPARQEQAARVLTVLDFWSQKLVPSILLQQARTHAFRSGDVARAAGLGRKVRRELLQVQGFAANAVHDASLRNRSSVDIRALRAAGVAWAKWASAILRAPRSPRDEQTRHVADLEANAVRLHQAAYETVNASIRAALETEK